MPEYGGYGWRGQRIQAWRLWVKILQSLRWEVISPSLNEPEVVGVEKEESHCKGIMGGAYEGCPGKKASHERLRFSYYSAEHFPDSPCI